MKGRENVPDIQQSRLNYSILVPVLAVRHLHDDLIIMSYEHSSALPFSVHLRIDKSTVPMLLFPWYELHLLIIIGLNFSL